MVLAKKKGYRAERKVRELFEQYGWKVLRAGASLGLIDLVALKNKKCLLLQIKSKKAKALYYYGYMKDRFEGFPFYLIVDFGYGNIRIAKPRRIIKANDGVLLEKFLKEK